MRRSLVYVILPLTAFCLFLLPGTASAQEGVIPGLFNSQVTGVAGISTELVKVGHTPEGKNVGPTALPPKDVQINWGDGQPPSAGDVACVPVSPTFLHPGYASCDYWGEHTYAKPGTYTVTVTYSLLNLKLFTAIAQIDPIGNFVIVSVGDSVASGEGNPDVPASPPGTPLAWAHPAYWSVNTSGSNGCSDQSSKAAPVVAAQELQGENPATRVSIVHLACSGAEIHDAVNEIENTGLPSGQQVDALVMTVGADSAYTNPDNGKTGFSQMVFKCIDPQFLSYDCAQDPTFQTTLDNGLDNLHSSYPSIEQAIQKEGVEYANADVYITEYFDPTHDAFGQFPTLAETDKCTEALLHADEWSYLYSNAVLPLNRAAYYASTQYGWHFVGGPEINGTHAETDGEEGGDNGNIHFTGPYFPIANDFADHGYCVGRDGLPGTSWVVGLGQSLTGQVWFSGTSHPNSYGQQEYATQIVNAINYYTPPETTATATSNGKPYTFGTWATHSVYVTLYATNKLDSAGVGSVYYSEDDSTCTATDTQSCMAHQGQGPFTFNVNQPGQHTIYFFSSNKSGTKEKLNSVQVWIDAPPVMSCTATPSVLWAPNHKLVPVNLNVTAVSQAFGPLPFTLTSVTTSEGNPQTDIQGFTPGTASTQGWLRASRTGFQPAGRIYTFTYKSTDPVGLSSTCTTTVTVPHDQGRR